MLLNQTAHMFEDPQALFFITVSRLRGQVGGGIQAEPRHAQLEPKEDDVLDLFQHRGRGQVQVRFVAIEHVPVVLSRFVVPGPDALLHAGKHGGRIVVVTI